MPDRSEWPHALRAAMESPPLERRGWQSSLAPQLIAVFLWIAYFDQIPQETLGPAGILWPVLGAALAGLLAYLLLYRAPALWGLSTRRPLGVIAASTFGVKGATWVPGLLLAGASVVWLAVATNYATTLSLRGLVLLQLLEPRYLLTMNSGRSGTQGVLFLVTSLLWCYAAAFVGRYLVRVIAALMNVFPVVPALILGVTAVLALKGLRGYQGGGGLNTASGVLTSAGPYSARLTVQMIFGFFATAGLASADWGVVARDARDVRAGGWVGVVLASWVVATLALLTTAGATTREGSGGPSGLLTAGPLRYTSAVESMLGGKFAGAVLLVFGLAALAPACYSSFVFSVTLNDTYPRVRRTLWTILGAGAAWLLVSAGLVGRMLDVFSVVGGLVAPAVGALTADYVRSRGVWPGGRRGYNIPGLLAWFVGAVAGLAPLLGRAVGVSWLAAVQPASVLAFCLAFGTYLVAAGLGAESGLEPGLDPPPPRETPAVA